MILWLLHQWRGYLYVCMSGFGAERFFNLCAANGIELWEVIDQEKNYQFYMTLPGYRASKLLMRKANIRLRILRKMGLPFFLYRNRRRKLSLLGMLMCILLFYSMSLFIWDISFEGNTRYTDEMLVQYVNRHDIHYGMRKSQISCDKIEAGIRNEFSEITWVSAQVSGTKLFIKIKESEVLSIIPVKDETPSDLVASDSGTITKMMVRSGIAQVSIGDEVEKGQVLVSGAIPVTNDNEELITIRQVHADADIYGILSYSYTKEYPRLHTVTVKTGKERIGYYGKAFQYSAVLLVPDPQNRSWNFTKELHQMKIFENFYLPFYYGIIRGTEYQTYERFYTREEENALANQIENLFLKNLMEKGVHIIENNVKILDNESVCRIEGIVTVEKSIGQDLPMIKRDEMRMKRGTYDNYN
ncbi:MAG: sporulation protein YqfD [Hungatella sp.]